MLVFGFEHLHCVFLRVWAAQTKIFLPATSEIIVKMDSIADMDRLYQYFTSTPMDSLPILPTKAFLRGNMFFTVLKRVFIRSPAKESRSQIRVSDFRDILTMLGLTF